MAGENWWQQNFFPWGSMHFGGRSRFFDSGEVRLALLSLLSEGPKHGYQLMKELGDRSGGIYRASAGSVYPTLQQMEDEGLVVCELVSGRRTYSLTDTGRQELEKDPDAVRRIWQRAEKWEEFGHYMKPDVVHVMGPLAEVAKAAWKAAGRNSGNREKEDRMRSILDGARRDLDQL